MSVKETNIKWGKSPYSTAYDSLGNYTIAGGYGPMTCNFTVDKVEDNISAELSELPYCCGILELGSLSSIHRQSVPAATEYVDTIAMLCAYPIVVNVTDEDWIEALSNSTKFTLINTFENPNTHNTIYTFFAARK